MPRCACAPTPWWCPCCCRREASAAQPRSQPIPPRRVQTSPRPSPLAGGGPATPPPVNSAYTPSPVAELPPSFEEDVKPKPKKKKYKSSRRLRRGTPQYNLMLSLGGVY